MSVIGDGLIDPELSDARRSGWPWVRVGSAPFAGRSSSGPRPCAPIGECLEKNSTPGLTQGPRLSARSTGYARNVRAGKKTRGILTRGGGGRNSSESGLFSDQEVSIEGTIVRDQGRTTHPRGFGCPIPTGALVRRTDGKRLGPTRPVWALIGPVIGPDRPRAFEGPSAHRCQSYGSRVERSRFSAFAIALPGAMYVTVIGLVSALITGSVSVGPGWCR